MALKLTPPQIGEVNSWISAGPQASGCRKHAARNSTSETASEIDSPAARSAGIAWLICPIVSIQDTSVQPSAAYHSSCVAQQFAMQWSIVHQLPTRSQPG